MQRDLDIATPFISLSQPRFPFIHPPFHRFRPLKPLYYLIIHLQNRRTKDPLCDKGEMIFKYISTPEVVLKFANYV